jgi:transcriptional regulator with XRE-family HTH domain
MNEFMESFGKWLAVQRKLSGMSIRQTAEKAGLEPSFYCKIENGLRKDIRLSTIAKIGSVFETKSFIKSFFA